MSKELRLIPVELIIPNKNQPRQYFDDDAISELSESIKSVGIIQPLSIREREDGKYDLISGERRLRASILAGLTKVPCVLIRAEKEDMEVMALVENIQREDLNYVEEAKAYMQLIEKYSFTQQQLAEKVGKKQSTISNKMRILKLGPEVIDLLIKNNLSERHARALLQVPDTAIRIRAIESIIKRDLNVRQTEELVERLKAEVLMNSNRKNIKNVFNYKVYTNTIKQAYDTILKTGIDANYKEEQFDDRVEVRIIIPIDK